MAGDWIKMRADLFTHPKVFRVAELLNKDELFTVGALFCFWAWADKHCVDGHVDGATSRLIDRATRVDGLSDALIAVGWLEFDDAGARIPRFEEHNGDSAKERSLKNQRQARWRAGKAAKDVDGGTSTKASTQSTTKPSTREEKRREEINTPKPPSGVEIRFERFWAAYPKKVGRDAALKAFEKRKPDSELLDLMLAAVNAQKLSPAWVKDGGQFIPNPATWLNQGRWQDESSSDAAAGQNPIFAGVI